MGVLRSDRVSGLGGANAINGSVKFATDRGAGQGTYLELHDPDDDLKFGTSDWTIEFWMYANTIDTSGQENDLASILDFGYGSSNNATGAWFAVHQEDATLHLGFNNANQVQSSNFLSANTWHHIAITRTSNTAKIYGDGTQVATVSCSQNFTDAIWRLLQIGSQAASGVERNFDGYISNLRIINGTALYTAAFTPPTTRLEKTSDTVLLCCQSPGNVFKEETGKSIVVGTLSKKPGPTASHFAPDKGEDHGTTFGDNTKFDILSYMVPPGGTTEQRGRGRGAFAGGETPTKVNSIEYVNIQSMGTAKDFGDLTTTTGDLKGLGSSTRGVFRVDNNPTSRNVLEYITFATTSNSTDFGDLNIAVQQRPGASNQTRGIFAGGLYPGSTTYNDMDYITIASTGNAADFGNLSVSRADTSALASPTRMVVAGGWTPGPTYSDVIDYVTIATTGDAADFGDLSTGKRSGTAVASSTRGVFGPGKAPSVSNVIDYITIASTGNATDFGDALVARGGAGSASNSIRGLFAGGYNPSKINGIEFITIASTGNGADFGDMTFVSQYGGGCSDSHGGIS